MGALNPLFLLAGLAVAVPLWLHLFQRHRTRRLSFPALRYLERTEREHARQIRLRQILLLLARVAVLLLLVGAGARLFFGGRGASHPPTAVVVVLDNSMSSGLVAGERRVLDELKAVALTTLAEATDDDRFWVVRAGEPWVPALPGDAADAHAAVEETDVSDARGDLSAALLRARRLLETSDLPRREIHLISDLQATAFDASEAAPAGDFPVVVYARDADTPANRALTSVTVGGGLPPLEGRRTDVTVSALEATASDDTTLVPVRLVVGERIRGAGSLPPGAQTTLALPPAGTGWVMGYVDADPDDLRADDRRHFAFRSRPPPNLATAGTPGVFVDEALAVLEDAERIRRSGTGTADLLVSHAGAGLDLRGPETAVVVFPPDDVTLLPALNRRLSEAGIPWSYEPATVTGEADLTGPSLPSPLTDVRVRSAFRLESTGDPPAPPRTLAEVDGRTWAVEGGDPAGRPYLLVASPMSRDASTLPVSTSMLRFVDWLSSEWAGAGVAEAGGTVGATVPAPSGATAVRFPSGEEREIDGTRMVRGTGEAGFYTFLDGDSVLSVIALNPPTAESRLAPLDDDALETAVGEEVGVAEGEDEWAGEIFRVRQGPELWRPFLLAALLLLLVEALAATSGTGSVRGIRKDGREAPAGAHGG